MGQPLTELNVSSAEQRYIVVSNTCEKGQRRYIVAYATAPYYSHRETTLSRNKFVKRYKWLNFSVEALREMFHKLKKLLMGLTFCYIPRYLIPRLCIRQCHKIEIRYGRFARGRSHRFQMTLFRTEYLLMFHKIILHRQDESTIFCGPVRTWRTICNLRNKGLHGVYVSDHRCQVNYLCQ